MTSLLAPAGDPLLKSEVTYISPPPPTVASAPKRTQKHLLYNPRKAKYAQLVDQQDENLFLLQQNESEQEKGAWNNILTWLLALLALILLPFALHYGLKSTKSSVAVLPTGMQMSSIHHQSKHPTGPLHHIPAISAPPSSPTPFPHLCVCTVRRINKLTNEVRTSTLKFPIARPALHGDASWDEECERLCATERSKMIEMLNAEERPHDFEHKDKSPKPTPDVKPPKLAEKEDLRMLEQTAGSIVDALFGNMQLENVQVPFINDEALFDMLLSSIATPEMVGNTPIRKPVRVPPPPNHITEDLFSPLFNRELSNNPFVKNDDSDIHLLDNDDLLLMSQPPALLSAMLLGMGTPVNETAEHHYAPVRSAVGSFI